MSLFQAYLQSPKARRVLSRKPGQKGFSLIELVVVVAVLAILAAIAIPSFTSISQEARVAGAKSGIANLAKECAVKLVGSGAKTYVTPTIDSYKISALSPAIAGTCGTADIYAATANDGSLPTFTYNSSNGEKKCTSGVSGGANKDLGCNSGTW